MILVGGAGGIAGVASLFVLMFEAIKRKRNHIGIMRAMGLSKEFITQIFLFQAAIYGIGGFLCAFVIFKLFTFFLDSDRGHKLLAIEGLEGQVFSASVALILLFTFAIGVVSLIPGRLSAQTARNVDPADILTGN